MKKILYISCLLISLVCSGIICRAQQEEDVQGALITAVGHFNEADYASARAILDSLEKVGVKDDAVEYYLGLCDICDRKYDSAETHFRNAVAMDSSNYWYHDWLANVLVGTNQVDAAIQEYEYMMSAYPKRNELYFNLVNLYVKKGEYEKVLATLDTIDTVFGKSDMVVSARMDILNRLGRTDDIIAMLDEMIEEAADDPLKVLQALETEMMVYYDAKDYASIIEVAKRMINTFPADSEIVVSAYTTMGDAYHSAGDPKKAYKCYDKALKIAPDYCPLLNNYAYYLSEEGRQLRKAYKMSKATIEKEPDNATYLDTFGWILFLQGKAVEAKPFFKHAMLYGGKESHTVLSHYATVLRALGEDDLAAYYEGLAAGKKTEE